jgi:hypothetical protein
MSSSNIMSNWNILVLDRSASMLLNKDKIINGYSELVKEQKEQGSTDKFTVVGFNTEVKIIKDEVFPNVSEMSENEFYTVGRTALLDAVGTVYDIILKNSGYDKITITVITDGLENSSKIYNYSYLTELRKKVDEKNDIKIVFIGSDINCLKYNIISNHVSQSVNVNGNMLQAMRTASRTMSSDRENIDYVPEGTVDIKIINSVSIDSETPMVCNQPPRPKRQQSYAIPPPVSKCGKICNLN